MRDPRAAPPQEQRFGGPPGGPRDPRDPRADRGPPDRFHKGPGQSPQQQWGPPQGGPPRGPNGSGNLPPGQVRPPGPGAPPVSVAPVVPTSGPEISAQDQEKVKPLFYSFYSVRWPFSKFQDGANYPIA